MRDILSSDPKAWENNELLLSNWMITLDDGTIDLLHAVYIENRPLKDVGAVFSKDARWVGYRLNKAISPIKSIICKTEAVMLYNVIGSDGSSNVERFLIDLLGHKDIERIRSAFSESSLNDSAKSEVVLDWLERKSLSHEFEMFKICIGLYPGDDYLGLWRGQHVDAAARTLNRIKNKSVYKSAAKRIRENNAVTELITMILEKEKHGD